MTHFLGVIPSIECTYFSLNLSNSYYSSFVSPLDFNVRFLYIWCFEVQQTIPAVASTEIFSESHNSLIIYAFCALCRWMRSAYNIDCFASNVDGRQKNILVLCESAQQKQLCRRFFNISSECDAFLFVTLFVCDTLCLWRIVFLTS